VGLSTSKKKKDVLQTNKQEQNPTALSCWLEGVFFKKKEVNRVKPLRLFSLETSRNQGFSEKKAGCEKTGPNHTNCVSLVSIR
jgi:hypothetical protein